MKKYATSRTSSGSAKKSSMQVTGLPTAVNCPSGGVNARQAVNSTPPDDSANSAEAHVLTTVTNASSTGRIRAAWFPLGFLVD